MYKAIKLRIYPNESQKVLMDKTFGCCRFLFNYLLDERINFYEKKIRKKKATWKDYVRTTEKELKNKKKYNFLKEVSAVSLQQSRMNLDMAFKNFFDNIKGKNKSKANYPKFKSKKDRQSYREVQLSKDCLNLSKRIIKIPKIGKVSYRHSDDFPEWFRYILDDKPNNITISKSKSGNYYCSLMFEVDDGYKPRFNRNKRKLEIGLDFDLDDCYIDSNDESAIDYGFKKYKQLNHKKLSRLQKSLSRKKKFSDDNGFKYDSNNRKKARIKLSKLEEHISNCRKDWIEKETLRLVKTYKNVYIEDLNVSEMLQEIHNAKNYVDTSWGMFRDKLIQKSFDYDCNVIQIDKYFPSSKLCHVCNYKNSNLKLSHKYWICPKCKTRLDRDYNAALNILREGKRIRLGK